MLANSKKNRNIKANDVNLISAARSTDFCFKTAYVAMFLCFRSIVPCFQCLVRGPLPFGKLFPMNPPSPLEITAFEPPSSSEFPMIFLAGAGGGYGYFLEPHVLNIFIAFILRRLLPGKRDNQCHSQQCLSQS